MGGGLAAAEENDITFEVWGNMELWPCCFVVCHNTTRQGTAGTYYSAIVGRVGRACERILDSKAPCHGQMC